MFFGIPKSAICVQRFDDSLNSAIHITYRVSLRSSSMREPRDPLLKVVFHFFFLPAFADRLMRCIQTVLLKIIFCEIGCLLRYTQGGNGFFVHSVLVSFPVEELERRSTCKL